MCSECAFEPFCGADPVYHYATQHDYVGKKPLSDFCYRHMAMCRQSHYADAQRSRDARNLPGLGELNAHAFGKGNCGGSGGVGDRRAVVRVVENDEMVRGPASARLLKSNQVPPGYAMYLARQEEASYLEHAPQDSVKVSSSKTHSTILRRRHPRTLDRFRKRADAVSARLKTQWLLGYGALQQLFV